MGYDNVLGYLNGGIHAWKGELDTIQRVEASELEGGITKGEVLIDVRKPGEYDVDHLENVPNIPLDFINERMTEFPNDKSLILHCAGGYRSMIAASILKSRGFHQIKDVVGGFNALAKTSIPRVSQTCSKGLV